MSILFLIKSKNYFYTYLFILIVSTFVIAFSVRLLFVSYFKFDSYLYTNFQIKNPILNELKFPFDRYKSLVEGNMIRDKMVNSIPTLSKEYPENTILLIDDTHVEELLLTGVIGGDKSFARALFKEKDKEDSEEYGISNKIGNSGYLLKKISEHFVIISKGQFELKIEVGESIQVAKSKLLKKRKILTQNSNERIIRKISRTDFYRYIDNSNNMYGVKFGPNLVNDEIDGYKIYWIPKGHLFYELGAKNGDLIKRINGIPLNNTQKLLEIWANIKNSSDIFLDLERKEQILTYHFIITN